MADTFSQRDLYGGAIVISLPSDTFDVSDLRQVPDHQEVFLRPNTLTSIVIEINEYQTQGDIQSNTDASLVTAGPNVEQNVNSTIPAMDASAASHHIKDIVDSADYISAAGIETTAIKLIQPSVSGFPAYRSTTSIIEPKIDHSATSPLPQHWQTNPAMKKDETKLQQLLIRMEKYATDLCVRIHIPMAEYGGTQSEAALTELAIADAIMLRIIETLDIKDFGLFGGE